jgi:hypothetical protein
MLSELKILVIWLIYNSDRRLCKWKNTKPLGTYNIRIRDVCISDKRLHRFKKKKKKKQTNPGWFYNVIQHPS